ncbi:hypothetical protein DM43_2743 [Burkholderia cepacia]|uniref:Uncharacterized protein n=1 Tax=Burkholderia cepacia TaxID=292 RepID=A0AA88Z450_BURCE|nr:hypothetical protein DM43_2743 [Burkholderia cepacia]
MASKPAWLGGGAVPSLAVPGEANIHDGIYQFTLKAHPSPGCSIEAEFQRSHGCAERVSWAIHA